MPLSKSKAAEEAYNVVNAQEYPQLSLHSACSNGNIGLVKYALSNGQPANSVLMGISPLHAACSNGDEAIVRMLIENGADVNAPRLPRRLTNEKKLPGLSVGTSGSTPLHFAAANGHSGVIGLLLACGARPDLTEKRGMTPEDVAREHGHEDAIQALRIWDPDGASYAYSALDDDYGPDNSSSTHLPPPGSASGSRSPRMISSPSFSSIKQSLAASRLSRSRRSSESLKPDSSFQNFNRTASNPNLAAAFASANSSRASFLSMTSMPKSANDMTRQNSGPTMTYSSLTHRPTSVHSSEHRRPSLPSVFEKAAHPRAAIRQALGMSSNRPPPLHLKESNADAFTPENLAPKLQTRSSSRSSVMSYLRNRSASTSRHDSDASAQSTDLNALRRRHASDDGAWQNQSTFTSPIGSPEESPELPSTAPPVQNSFEGLSMSWQDGDKTPRSASLVQSQSTSRQSSAVHHYRPRQASQLSNPQLNLDRKSEDAQDSSGPSGAEDDLPPMQSPELLASRRFRSFSGSRVRSYSNSSRAESSSTGSNAQPVTSPVETEFLDAMPYLPDSVAQNEEHWDRRFAEGAPSHEEADDQLGSEPVSRSYQTPGRTRNNSVGSTSSSVSRLGLSPYAVNAPSPLASAAASSDRLHSPPLRSDEAAQIINRAKRSGSTSTEPDLRYLVLSSHQPAEQGMSSSPNSSSSMSGSQYYYPSSSAYSTSATSVNASSGSVRDPPASPRKAKPEISPSLAHSMVREAEQQLLTYDSKDPEAKQTLAQQLAAYSERLSLEREVNAKAKAGKSREGKKAKPKPPALAPISSGPYVWEKLSKDGVRTPLARQETDPMLDVVTPDTRAKNSRPFQQGTLDLRRPPPASLRQDTISVESPKLTVPQAVEPQAALNSAVNKIYDSRLSALQSHVSSLDSGRRPASTSSASTNGNETRSRERSKAERRSAYPKSVSSDETGSRLRRITSQPTSLSSQEKASTVGATPMRKASSSTHRHTKSSPTQSRIEEYVKATTPTERSVEEPPMVPVAAPSYFDAQHGVGLDSTGQRQKKSFGRKLLNKVF